MTVAKIMSTPVVTVAMDDPLSHVKALFDKSGFHHLLVVEDGKLVGVISDRDLLRRISPYAGTIAETYRDNATLDHRAHQIMTRELVTLNINQRIADAVTTFNNHKISCIPVVDDDNKPLGIVSWRDVMRALSKIKRTPPG